MLSFSFIHEKRKSKSGWFSERVLGLVCALGRFGRVGNWVWGLKV